MSSIKKSGYREFTTGLLVLLFIVAIVVVTLSVLLPIVAEFPLSLYFNSDVTHTVSTYSHGPGEKSWLYEYFVQTKEESYDRIPILTQILIPSFFYVLSAFVFFTFSDVKHCIKKEKQDAADSKGLMWALYHGTKKSSLKYSIITVFIPLISFFWLGNQGYMGALYPYIIDDSVSAESYAVPQKSTLFSSDESQLDEIWLVGQYDKNKYKYLIENNERVYKPDNKLLIHVVNKSNKVKFSTEVPISELGGSIYIENIDDKIWVVDTKNNLVNVYNPHDYSLLVNGLKGFKKDLPNIMTNIHEIRLYEDKKIIKILSKTGREQYLSMEEIKLYKSRHDIKKKSLTYPHIRIEGTSNSHLKIIASVSNDASTGYRLLSKKIEELIDVSMVGGDENISIISSKSDISDNAAINVQAYEPSGKKLWSISDINLASPLAIYDKNKFKKINVKIYKNTVLIKVYTPGSFCGYIMVNRKTGAELWRYQA